MKKISTALLVFVSFVLCAQPSNNNCLDAIVFSVSGGCQVFTNSGATPSGNPRINNFCGFNQDDALDVWFSIQVPASGKINIDFNASSNIYNMNMELYDGSCDNLIPMDCVDQVNQSMKLEQENLVSGNIYLLRVSSRNSNQLGQFQLCVTDQGYIDYPCKIELILPSTQGICDPVTNTYDQNLTVHYRHSDNAPINVSINQKIFTLQSSPAEITLYDLPASSGLMPVSAYFASNNDCGYFLFNNISHAYQRRSSCFAGNVVNDDCASAIMLGAEISCISTPGDNIGASFSGVVGGCTIYTQGSQDVWYKHTVSQDRDIIIDTWNEFSNPFQSPVFSVYKGICGQLEYLDCGNTSKSIRLRNLNVGDQLYIQVKDSQDNSQVAFNICLIYPIPTTNDVCSSAIPISLDNECDEMNVYSNNFGTPETNPSFTSDCSASSSSHRDLWYEITMPSTGNALLNIHPADGSKSTILGLSLEVFEGPCESLTSVGCDNHIIGSNIGKSIINRAPGEILYARVLQDSYNSNPYLICSPIAENDICNTATLITTDVKHYLDNFYTFATPSSNPNAEPSCGQTIDYASDIWFVAEVPPSGTMVIETESSNLLVVEVYSGMCDDLSSVACNFEDIYAGSPNIIYGIPKVKTVVKNQNPGDQLYIRIVSSTSISGFRLNSILVVDCPDDESFNYPLSGVLKRVAANSITGNNLILSNARIEFDAGQYVNLLDGFEVKTGAIFHALIDGCAGN